jgi:hypothetical protein
MKLLGLLLPAILASYSASALEVGENICVEGFIMDFFCIDRGTLLDNPAVRTLEEPQKHSVHCLVDVPSCFNSPFEVLLDPVNDENSATTNLYSRGWRLSEDAKTTVLALARDVGTSCSTCTGNGMLRKGFRAVMSATIVDLNEGAGIPATIDVGEAFQSNDLGDDPCSMFGLEDVLDTIANISLAPTMSRSPTAVPIIPTSASPSQAPTSAPTLTAQPSKSLQPSRSPAPSAQVNPGGDEMTESLSTAPSSEEENNGGSSSSGAMSGRTRSSTSWMAIMMLSSLISVGVVDALSL